MAFRVALRHAHVVHLETVAVMIVMVVVGMVIGGKGDSNGLVVW